LTIHALRHTALGGSRYDSGGKETQAVALSNERMSGSSRADRRCTFGAIKDEHLGKDAVAFVLVCTLLCTLLSTLSSMFVLSDCCTVPKCGCLRGYVALRLTCPCMRYKLFHLPLLQISGTVTFVRNENMSYPACQLQTTGKTCQKKCTENGGDWCVFLATWFSHTHVPPLVPCRCAWAANNSATITSLPTHARDCNLICRWCEKCQSVSPPTWRYVLSVTAQVTPSVLGSGSSLLYEGLLSNAKGGVLAFSCAGPPAISHQKQKFRNLVVHARRTTQVSSG
jgi:hypothetical protein